MTPVKSSQLLQGQQGVFYKNNIYFSKGFLFNGLAYNKIADTFFIRVGYVFMTIVTA